LTTAIVLAFTTATTTAVGTPSATDGASSPLMTPTITFVDDPSEAEREIVDWAVERYVEVGIQLPDLAIAFPVTCGGKAGRYLIGRALVELCRPTRKLLLHELAHAWDDSTTIDREGFMDRRGLDDWYEQPGRSSKESGGEQLALLVAWGLMDLDITSPTAEWPGQTRDQQPLSLPGVPDSSPDVLTELFEWVVGSPPLTPGRIQAGSTQ
jgi:hypothetical protein